jgi:hypothetical protein
VSYQLGHFTLVHLSRAMDNGLSKDELVTAMRHIDLYWNPDYVPQVAEKLTAFFTKNL